MAQFLILCLPRVVWPDSGELGIRIRGEIALYADWHCRCWCLGWVCGETLALVLSRKRSCNFFRSELRFKEIGILTPFGMKKDSVSLASTAEDLHLGLNAKPNFDVGFADIASTVEAIASRFGDLPFSLPFLAIPLLTLFHSINIRFPLVFLSAVFFRHSHLDRH